MTFVFLPVSATVKPSIQVMTKRFNYLGESQRTTPIHAQTERLSCPGIPFFAVLSLLCGMFAGSAQAVLTTLSYSPGLGDMAQNKAYTWRLDNLPTNLVTGATLTFSDIKNWDANANKLFTHLLDSANTGGVNSFNDGSSTRTTMADVTDDFANPRHHASPDWLVAPGTGDTKLFGKSFSMTPTSWTYTFNEAELTKLNQYLSDGTIAFGFDSDSHYFNEGITFSMMFLPPPPAASPIPEASTVLPLASILLLAVVVQSRSRRRGFTLPA